MGYQKATSVVEPMMCAVEWGDTAYGDLVKQYHALRKQVFVDQLGWDLPVHDGYEWDQYDGPLCTYILAVEDGKCVGGCRVQRTSSRFTVGTTEYSYMLRDAKRKLLPGIPDQVIDETPSGENIWELTRAISGRNPAQFKALMFAAIRYMKLQGGKECLFISRPATYKIGMIWGLNMDMVGKPTQIGSSKWLAARCNMELSVVD